MSLDSARDFLAYRSSTVVDVKPWRKSWDQHQKERYGKRKVMELEKELKEKAKQEKEEKKKRIEENRKRKEENRKKSEVVQKVKCSISI